jgi:3-methyladenine DNA glycosylase Tag
MHTPTQIKPVKLADYLAIMSRAVFQSGMNWQVIEKKWDGIVEAFDGFDPETVAGFTPDDVDRLMADPRVIRNLKKIQATIANAGELIVLEREFGGFEKYLASHHDNAALIKDLHKRFAFLGDSVAHFFLFGIGFDLPEQEKWAHEHFAHSESGAAAHGGPEHSHGGSW